MTPLLLWFEVLHRLQPLGTGGLDVLAPTSPHALTVLLSGAARLPLLLLVRPFLVKPMKRCWLRWATALPPFAFAGPQRGAILEELCAREVPDVIPTGRSVERLELDQEAGPNDTLDVTTLRRRPIDLRESSLHVHVAKPRGLQPQAQRSK